jgi:transcriptional regulator with XRE-family HTH domain
MTLRALRESLGKTQDEVAYGAAMTQPQLSRVEQRHDHLVSTLRKYIRAMGGEVDVIAWIDNRRIVLRDV